MVRLTIHITVDLPDDEAKQVDFINALTEFVEKVDPQADVTEVDTQQL